MEEFEPKRKIKIFTKEFFSKYSYVLVLAVLLIGGISYGYTFFKENKKIASGSITTADLTINFTDRSISASHLTVPENDYEGINEFSKSLTISNQSAIDGKVKLTLTRTSGMDLSDLKYALIVNDVIQVKDDVPSNGEILSSAILSNDTMNVEVRLWPKSTYSGTATTFVGELTPEVSYLGGTATDFDNLTGKYVNFNGNEVWQIVKIEDDRLVLTRQSDYSGATSRTNSNRYNSSLTFNDNSLITSVSTDNKNVYLAKTVKITGGSGTQANPYILENNELREEDKKVMAVITYKDTNNNTVGTQKFYYGETNYISQVFDDPDFAGWDDQSREYLFGDSIDIPVDVDLTVLLVPRLRTQILAKCNDSSVTYVKKYTSSQGTTTDTYDGRGTEDVCYYTSSNSNNLAGANGNVLFGDYCWQIIRTTDNGGTKLIYNGKPTADNKCTSDTQSGYSSNPRPASLGVIGDEQGVEKTNLSGNKLYGTGYEIINDNGTNKFKLTNTFNANWNGDYDNDGDLDYPKIIGNYVCGTSSSPTGTSDTCTVLYYVGIYQSSYQASTIKYTLGNTTHYSQIGTSPINAYSRSTALIGYMFNNIYLNLGKSDIRLEHYVIDKENMTSSYYYGDAAVWVTDHYELTMGGVTPTTTSSWSSIGSNAQGMYTCRSTTDTSCATVYYIVANSTSSYMYYIPLSNNEQAATKSVTWTIGTGYEENNGTYSLTGTSTLTFLLKDWYTNYNNSQYKGYYICDNLTNSTCTNEVYYVGSTYIDRFYYTKSSNNFVFGNSVTYENGVYKIDENSDPTKFHSVWNWSLDNNTLNNSHYTCFGRYNKTTRSCGSSVYYVYYTNDYSAQYIELKNGDTVQSALKKMINYKQNSNEQDENINVYNSSIKGMLDSFYETKISRHLYSLIDTTATYCSDRNLNSNQLGGWKANGGPTQSSYQLYFSTNSYSTNLSCSNVTDRFSIENNKAKLDYPIGLITVPEAVLSEDYFTRTSQKYWTMTPSNCGNNCLYGYITKEIGNVGFHSIDYSLGVRPVITLKRDAPITGGDGTYNNPYIVDTSK